MSVVRRIHSLRCNIPKSPARFRAIKSRRFSAGTNASDNSTNKNVFIPLHQRSYFRIEGRDTFKFLQGIITNDIHQLKEPSDCLACAILNPKGRVVADIFVYNASAAQDEHQVSTELCPEAKFH
jgi:hypothetical protein